MRRQIAFSLGALFLVAGFAALSPAQAADIQMVKVSSSYPSGYTGKITATVDDGGTGLTLFSFEDVRGTHKTFTADDVRTGVVLVHELGKDILKISGPSFARDAGGEMVLTFLRGFFGSDRREVRFEYLRNGGPADWQLQTDDSQGRDRFDAIAIQVKKDLGVPTGVASIHLKAGDQEIRDYNTGDLPAGTEWLGF